MAAEYEVNIKLNTQQVERELKRIESGVKKVGQTEKQSANSTDRRVAAMVKLRSIGNDIAALADKGLNVSKAQFQIKKASEAIDKKMFLTANSRMGVAVKELNVQRAITKQLEQQEKARRRQRVKRAEGVALGAGFPLLFGGGPGAVLGGGLGGLTGSFGAQIALSAIGQQVDRFVASVAAVGTALTSASGTVEMFREKNLFSSDAVKEHAFELEKQGKMQELATLLTKDLASQIGKNAVESFQLLGGETKEFLKTINLLFTAVQGFVAGPLAKFLGAINTVLGGVSTEMQFKNLRGSLTGEAAAQFEAIIAEARGTRQLTAPERQRAIRAGRSTDPVPGRLTTAAMLRALQDPRTAKLRQTIDVTGQTTLDDTLGFEPPVDKKAKEAARVAEMARRAQERLQIMQEEGDLAKELKQLDFERAAEIEKINKLETVGLEERQNAVQATNELFDAKKGQAIGEALAKDLQTAIDLKKAQEDILRPLEDQRRLLQGKLDGNEKEVRLQLEVERIMRSVKGLNKEDVENVVRKNALLEEQIAVVEKLDQVYASIGQSISSSIVNALTAAVDETKSLADIASQTLRQIANILLQFGVQTALSSLGGGDNVGFFSKLFPGKALGGAVGANQPYMVGEKGPELFVPGAQGNIVPNNAMGGSNIVVNVDASGSSVQGDGQQGKALGQAIGAAVKAEIIKQKMPGGLLN